MTTPSPCEDDLQVLVGIIFRARWIDGIVACSIPKGEASSLVKVVKNSKFYGELSAVALPNDLVDQYSCLFEKEFEGLTVMKASEIDHIRRDQVRAVLSGLTEYLKRRKLKKAPT